MKSNKIVSIALLSHGVRLLSGPLVILAISNQLTSEQIAYYYSFLSIVAIQQVLEMGVGFTIKQYISHAYVIKDDAWTIDSKKEVKSFFYFTKYWYFGISLFIFFVIGSLGYLFFDGDDRSNIEWKESWFFLILTASLIVNLIPYQILMEGVQRQTQLFRAQLLSSLVNALVLIMCMMLGMGLSSIAAALFISNLSLYALLYQKITYLMAELSLVKRTKLFKDTLSEVWPMLSKISVTWILGYFFWNSFNLISFKLLTLDLAGKLSLTISLALAGYKIASVLINSQSTLFGNYISGGYVDLAKNEFRKFNLISMAMLCLGYSMFILLSYRFDYIEIMSKTLSVEQTSYIFIYFISLLMVTNKASFCRCFKDEPYFILSLVSNFSIPVIYILVCVILKEPNFLYLLPFSMLFVFWSNTIYNKTIRNVNK